MAEKLSERLERIVRAPGIANHPAYTDAIREAAELALRVEGGTLVEWNHRAGIVRPDLYGQRVRIVPEAGQGGG